MTADQTEWVSWSAGADKTEWTLTVGGNAAEKSREAFLTIGDGGAPENAAVITIRQEAGAGRVPVMETDPGQLAFTPAGETKTFSVTYDGAPADGYTLEAEPDAGWIATAQEGGTASVTAEANTGGARETGITVRGGAGQEATVRVTQEGAEP